LGSRVVCTCGLWPVDEPENLGRERVKMYGHTAAAEPDISIRLSLFDKLENVSGIHKVD
jgi:hypothetical protein